MAGSESMRTYGNWKTPRKEGLLGFSMAATFCMIAAMLVVVLVIVIGGFLAGFVSFLCVSAVGLAGVSRDRHGRNLLMKMATRFSWWSRVFKPMGRFYRSGPVGKSGVKSFKLPGIAGACSVEQFTDSYGRDFAVVHSKAAGTFQVVLEAFPEGSSLVDQSQIDAWVAGWGGFLASLCQEPYLIGATVTVESVPDTGVSLRSEIDTNLVADAPDVARLMLENVRDTYPAGSSKIQAFVSLVFSYPAGRNGLANAGVYLASRLPGITANLSGAGCGQVIPVDTGRLCEITRVAYDPASSVLFDQARMVGEPIDIDWDNAGPAGCDTDWDSYRHDSGLSVTWAMSQAPRGIVYSSVFNHLLSPHPDIARKRVTLFYEPISPDKSASIVEADVKNALFAASSKEHGAGARDDLAVRQARATAAEEAMGAGLVEFGMLVTATVFSASEARLAKAAVDNLAGTARVLLRPCYGFQDAAFAACLPLGLMLSRHAALPKMVRDAL